jgi:hypothetical protein
MRKKFLIFNLSKGLVGEANANLLGSMLITKIYLGAMSRADFSWPHEASASHSISMSMNSNRLPMNHLPIFCLKLENINWL